MERQVTREESKKEGRVVSEVYQKPWDSAEVEVEVEVEEEQ